jgi:hypothetical protein
MVKLMLIHFSFFHPTTHHHTIPTPQYALSVPLY